MDISVKQVSFMIFFIALPNILTCNWPVNEDCPNRYGGSGITHGDITGFWHASGIDLMYVNKNGTELLVFKKDSLYYWKRQNSEPPNLFYEEYGKYSIGGIWNEMISFTANHSFEIVQYANGIIDSIEKTIDTSANVFPRIVGFRKDAGSIIKYDIVDHTPDCGYSILDDAKFIHIDSTEVTNIMWDKINKPVDWQ